MIKLPVVHMADYIVDKGNSKDKALILILMVSYTPSFPKITYPYIIYLYLPPKHGGYIGSLAKHMCMRSI